MLELDELNICDNPLKELPVELTHLKALTCIAIDIEVLEDLKLSSGFVDGLPDDVVSTWKDWGWSGPPS